MTHTNSGGRTESKTSLEKLREFTRKVVSVPKAEIDRRDAEYQRDENASGANAPQP